MLVVFSPSILKNQRSKTHDENRRFFQPPSVVEQQVDTRFSFFMITQTVVMLKILYILVNDELYLQFQQQGFFFQRGCFEMQVERIIVNFNPVFGLRNRRQGLKRFSCFPRKRTDLSKKKLHGVCTLTKVYQYAKEERFSFPEPCRTLVDICMELLLKSSQRHL